MKKVLWTVMGATLIATWSGAQAADVSACKDALVKATYNKFDTSTVDARLASYVTKDEYDKEKQGASINVPIYGVPVGGSWDDFQENIRRTTSAYSSSLSASQAQNLMWTGLDANSVTGYTECLHAQVLSSFGLHLVVTSATSSDISLIARWNPQGRLPGTINVTWDSVAPGQTEKLPRSITTGDTPFVIRRPSSQQTLVLRYPGFGDQVTLEPLPAVVTRPPATLPILDGKWCGTGPIPYTYWLHKTGDHVDFYTQLAPAAVTDSGYFDYYFQHIPPSEVPLFEGRTFSSNDKDTFTLVGNYTRVADPKYKFWPVRSEVTYQFLGADFLKMVFSTTTDQTGAVINNFGSTDVFKRCGGLPDRVVAPSNGRWKSSIPALLTGPELLPRPGR